MTMTIYHIMITFMHNIIVNDLARIVSALRETSTLTTGKKKYSSEKLSKNLTDFVQNGRDMLPYQQNNDKERRKLLDNIEQGWGAI